MIVVAYLYNTNGMATWCWEAAHALLEEGEAVCLVVRPGLLLPGTPAVSIVEFQPPAFRRFRSRFQTVVHALSGDPQTFLNPLHRVLTNAGIFPKAYLLNQSDLHSREVSVPQFVVGWANPPSLLGYCKSIFRHSNLWAPRRFVHLAVSCLGWYRKDWRAYRSVSGVIPVSRQLTNAISRRGPRANVVHPGTEILPIKRVGKAVTSEDPLCLLVAALDLDEPRKQVRLIIRALGLANFKRPISITFAGKASATLRAEASKLPFRTTFLGQMRRRELVQVYRLHDVFLFASAADDWGYVLVEALACGLVVVAPDQSPFDEIVFDENDRFIPGSVEDLARCVSRVVEGWNPSRREVVHQRSTQLFSRRAFARSVLAVINNRE